MLPEGVRKISVNALFGNRYGPNHEINAHRIMNEAELIFGTDVMSGRAFLVYGRDLLQEIANSGATRNLSVVAVELDQDTDELETLIALVQVLKGKDDYQESEE
jgi:hypothetical protein